MVLTILKNISQWEGLSHIIWKNKSYVPNHQPDIYYIYSDTWYGLLCDERLSNHLLGGAFWETPAAISGYSNGYRCYMNLERMCIEKKKMSKMRFQNGSLVMCSL